MRAVCCALLFWLVCARAQAHELALWVLSLRQVSQEDFVARWERMPGAGDADTAHLLLRPLFPAACRFRAPALHCPGGLHGALGFEGLGEVTASALMQVHWLSGPASSYTFHAAEPRVQIERESAEPAWSRVALNFLALGVEHIAFGWDHLLFVLGLLWLVPSRRALFKTITGFTVAHSLTLSAATLGVSRVPVPPIEALIALSIVFVAVEAVKQRRDGALGLSSRAPWLVAFGFGLLHGFGFASALAEIELPRTQLPLALVSFNVGVELGQLAFVSLITGVRWLVRRWQPPLAQRVTPLLQYAAGTLAMYWFVERVAAFAVK